jgi:hypothetical protein
MRITNPQSGRSYVEKRRRRYAEPGQPRELKFSCYRRYLFLGKERTREWFRRAIDYIHANPVRRGLVEKAEDWEWSSARWYAGIRPVKIEMDSSVMVELARDGLLDQVCRRGEVGAVKH